MHYLAFSYYYSGCLKFLFFYLFPLFQSQEEERKKGGGGMVVYVRGTLRYCFIYRLHTIILLQGMWVVRGSISPRFFFFAAEKRNISLLRQVTMWLGDSFDGVLYTFLHVVMGSKTASFLSFPLVSPYLKMVYDFLSETDIVCAIRW